MECNYCGCKIDGEPFRIFMRDLNGDEHFIKDVALCPDGVNENTDCTSEWMTRIRSCITKIKKPETVSGFPGGDNT